MKLFQKDIKTEKVEITSPLQTSLYLFVLANLLNQIFLEKYSNYSLVYHDSVTEQPTGCPVQSVATSVVVTLPRCGTPFLPNIPLQVPHSQQHRNIPPPLSHVITRPGQQMRLDGRLEATAGLCFCPWLSECGSIDEVLLNIKMRAQIKGIIAEAGRSRPELVEGNMVGQANNMFWLMTNELQVWGVDLGEVYGWWCGWYEGIG